MRKVALMPGRDNITDADLIKEVRHSYAKNRSVYDKEFNSKEFLAQFGYKES